MQNLRFWQLEWSRIVKFGQNMKKNGLYSGKITKDTNKLIDRLLDRLIERLVNRLIERLIDRR